MSPEQKYMTDAVFHSTVDAMEALIHQAKLTPGEVREAAMLAAIHYEMKNVRYMHEHSEEDQERSCRSGNRGSGA